MTEQTGSRPPTTVAGFLDAHRSIVIWVLASSLLAYGFSVATFSLSIDEEVHLLFDHSRVWTQQGRFGTTLIKLLLGSTYPIPHFQSAVAILLLALSALVWCLLFVRVTSGRVSGSPWLTTFAVAYVTMPTNAYYLSFTTYSLEVSAGAVCMAAAVLVAFEYLDRRRAIAYAGSALLAGLAIATYQSFTLVAAVGIAVAFLLRLGVTAEARTSARATIVDLLRLSSPVLVGHLLYTLVNRQIVEDGAYLDTFLNWGRLETSFLVPWLWWHVQNFYSGIYFVGGRIVPILGVVGLAVAVRMVVARIGGQRLIPALLWTFVLASPVLLSLAFGTHMPNRTQQALPLAFGVVPLMMAVSMGRIDRWRCFAIAVTLFVLLSNAQATSRLFFTEYLSFTEDVAIGRRVGAELVDRGWTGEAAPIVVFGTPVRPPTIYFRQSETIGVSFFDHDSGERASYFLKFLSYPFRLPTRPERQRALSAVGAMPNWPRSGSVAWVDGIAIVRFGPPTEFQLRLITPRAPGGG